MAALVPAVHARVAAAPANTTPPTVTVTQTIGSYLPLMGILAVISVVMLGIAAALE